MTQSVEYHAGRDHIALLRINRPRARNALDWEAQQAFAAAASRAQRDDSIRALIVTGAGTQAFVSGADLKELSAHPEPAAGERLTTIMSQALNDLVGAPFPVIAAVNGDAIGGGCEILTACDLRLASPGARFSFRQVYNGLTTGWGGAGRLVELIGQSRAMELLLTGRTFDAAEARQLGLIHRVVPDNTDVVAAAQAWAGELIRLPKRALAATKVLVHAAVHLAPADVRTLESQLFINLWPSADHLEAMQAFVEKREPEFNCE